MNRTIYALCIFLAASSAAQALSYSTAEGVFTHQLSTLAEIYSTQHEGHSPSSWSDLKPYLDRPIDDAFRYITPTKRYAFLTQPLHLPPPHEGDLLVITRRPFRDGRLYTNWYGGIGHGLREPGRYIIYRSSTGAFQASYVEEAYIQQAFRGSESLLPSPDTEPLRRHESEARWRSIITWAVATLIAAAFLARSFFRRSSTSPDNGRNA